MKNQSQSQKHYEKEKSSFPLPVFLIGIASVLIVLQVFGIFKTVDKEHKAHVMDVHSGVLLAFVGFHIRLNEHP